MSNGEILTFCSFSGPYTQVAPKVNNTTSMSVSLWNPTLPPNDTNGTYYYLGSVGLGLLPPSSGFTFTANTVLVADTSTSPTLIASPTAFNQIYQDVSYSLWVPQAPIGFVGIGLVATTAGAAAPATASYGCIRETAYLVGIAAASGGIQQLYNNYGNPVPFQISLWSLPYSNCIVPSFGWIQPGQGGGPPYGSPPVGPLYDIDQNQLLGNTLG
jgi:hypothetical protein